MSCSKVPFLTLNNGVKMPQLGIGTYKSHADEADNAVKHALKIGIRLIDTAYLYENESYIGKAVKESGVPREEIFITTKLWNTYHGYENALAAFERSCIALDLDYIDLYLIHWPGKDMNSLTETWRAFEKLYNDKKVRAIGLSNFNIEHIEHILSICSVSPMVNQIELHVLFQQTKLRKYCKEKNIVITGWRPLGDGKFASNSTIVALAEKYHCTPAQILIRWQLQLGIVVIPKSVKQERITENFCVLDFELDESSITLLNSMDDGQRTGPDPSVYF
ncbi:unnamed protein product [Phytomonas sp. Hart1]|nr:unnamed protein product [Phytomonas sp. Hart1]|eukprot:CCW70545.1 unnamed protein product [Phytomonas sp. isolate Hart1]